MSRRGAALVVAFALGASALELRGDRLIVSTQVVGLTNGKLTVPIDTEYLLMEIGCSDFDTIALDVLPNHPKAFSISYEPMLDKYASLISRGSKSFSHGNIDVAVPLGHVNQRGVVLPIAIATTSGAQNFTVTNDAGCSSLAKQTGDAGWGHNCDGLLERRQVESMTLTQSLQLLPAHLKVRWLKIDAQGVDFSLIKSAPSALMQEKVESISLEVRSSECKPLYEGQPGCEEVVAQMVNTYGYRNMTACPNPNSVDDARFNNRATGGCEDEIHFSTTGTFAVPEADETHKARRASLKAEGAAWLAAMPESLKQRKADGLAGEPIAQALQAHRFMRE